MRKKSRVYIINLNKRVLVLSGIIVFMALCAILFKGYRASKIFKYQPMEAIVIDPGHGGIDGGAGDKEGLLEKDINLDIGLKLKKELTVENFRVVMTRERDQSLEGFSNIKASRYRRDLDARKSIINRNAPAAFISIHVNSSIKASARGIKIYHYPDCHKGKELAESICESVDANIYDRYLKDDTLRAEILSEDYFILRETNFTGALVEVGFITNPEENKLLQNETYQSKVAFAIKKGIIKYLSGQED